MEKDGDIRVSGFNGSTDCQLDLCMKVSHVKEALPFFLPMPNSYSPSKLASHLEKTRESEGWHWFVPRWIIGFSFLLRQGYSASLILGPWILGFRN
ncbi:MAG: hypothetical protein EBT92_15220 [Planctomycetes bacterium]|nr:hypothetical protein [Planctomycetota bacterium]